MRYLGEWGEQNDVSLGQGRTSRLGLGSGLGLGLDDAS